MNCIDIDKPGKILKLIYLRVARTYFGFVFMKVLQSGKGTRRWSIDFHRASFFKAKPLVVLNNGNLILELS